MARRPQHGDGSKRGSGGVRSGKRRSGAPSSAAIGRRSDDISDAGIRQIIHTAHRKAERQLRAEKTKYKGRLLSKAYAKRLAAAEAKGKTLTQARGHKPREHVERRRRDIAAKRPVTDQRQAMARFFERQLEKDFGRSADVAAYYRDFVKAKVEARGWVWFTAVRAERARLHRMWKARGSPNSKERAAHPEKRIFSSASDLLTAVRPIRSGGVSGGVGGGEDEEDISDISDISDQSDRDLGDFDTDDMLDYDLDDGDEWMLFYH